MVFMKAYDVSDGLLLEREPLLRSIYFWMATAVGTGCLVWALWLTCAYWNLWVHIGLQWYSVPVVLQPVFLWIRVLRYYRSIEAECHSAFPADRGSSHSTERLQARITGSLIDILFWSFALNTLMLASITVLVAHLGSQ